MRMRTVTMKSAAAAGVLAMAVLGGCESSGLSVREPRGKDYSTYVFSMYGHDDAPAAGGTTGSAIPPTAGANAGAASSGGRSSASASSILPPSDGHATH